MINIDSQQRREMRLDLACLTSEGIQTCNWQWRCGLKVDEGAHRTEMAIECLVQCYEHLEKQYGKLERMLKEKCPGLDAGAAINAVRDSTLVQLDVSDGLAHCTVKMRAAVAWSSVTDRYEKAMGIAPAYGEAHDD